MDVTKVRCTGTGTRTDARPIWYDMVPYPSIPYRLANVIGCGTSIANLGWMDSILILPSGMICRAGWILVQILGMVRLGMEEARVDWDAHLHFIRWRFPVVSCRLF